MSPPFAGALRAPLLELGFQFSEASRGEEALQLLHSAAYDVVLLDINMPGSAASRRCGASGPLPRVYLC